MSRDVAKVVDDYGAFIVVLLIMLLCAECGESTRLERLEQKLDRLLPAGQP